MVASIAVLASPVVVEAQTAEADISAKAGVTPDSFLWGLDVALDKLRLLFTFSDEDKARVGLEIAAERLAEIKVSAEANKIDAVQSAEREHKNTLADVKAKIAAFKKDKAEAELETTVELERKVEEHDADVEEVRADLEVKIKGRGELTQQQRELLQTFLDSLDTSTDDVRVEIREKKSQIRAEFEAEGRGDDEINEIFNQTERREGLHEFFKEAAAERIADAKKAIAEAKEAAAELSASISVSANATNTTAVQRLTAGLRLIERAEFHLNVSETAFAEAHYGKAFGQATAAFHIARNAKRILTHEIEEEEGLKEAEEEEIEHEEKVEIKIESEDNTTHVEVEIKRNGFEEEVEFTLDTTDCATIKAEIDARTSLTAEEVDEFVGAECEVQASIRAKFEREFEERRAKLEHKFREGFEEFREKLEARLRAHAEIEDIFEEELEENETEET